MHKLTILMPVFNEEKTIAKIIDRVNAVKLPKGIVKELIIIDDGSADNTSSEIESACKNLSVDTCKMLKHAKNQGKGKAVRTGIKEASGDYIIIQDADLEYNPEDIKKLIKPVLEKEAEVVYGTRINRLPNLSGEERKPQFLLHYLGNRFLSLLTSILYGQWITDMETCYKLFPKKVLSNIPLNSRGFEFEPEITAKLLKQNYKIMEIPIKTNPRDMKEGKKLRTFRDGVKALYTLFLYRF